MRRSSTVVMIMLTLLLSLSVSAALTHRYSFNTNPDPNDPNVYDLVGTANGTLVSTGGTTGAAISNGQVVMPGTADNYVNLPGPTINIPSYSAVTIEQWINSAVANSGFTMTFVAGLTGNPGMQYLDMQPTRNGATTDGCRFTISNTQWSTEAWSQRAQMNDGIQHHLVGTVDGTSIQLYVDGVAMPSMALTTQTIALLSNESIYLGRSVYTGDVYFVGSINETRIYNSVLGSTAITLNNQLGPDKYQACALTDMSPTNDAINVAIPTAFSWTPAAGITVDHYEVFIKTDPNVLDPNAFPTPAGTPDYSGPLTTYTKAGLPNLSVRYWRVDTIAADTTRYTGPRFKFTTAPATPVFSVQPGFSAAFPGGTAVLTATSTSATPLLRTIQWYNPAGTELTTGGDITVAETTAGALTTSTLTINNVALATEGNYYAKATNAGGSTNSTNGKVIIKRLFAYYPFEGNANDASGNGLNGTAATLGVTPNNVLPTYSAGKVGQAVNLSNTYANYIDLPDGFADFRSGLTFNVWAYPTVAGNWANFIQFSNLSGTTPSENIFFTRNGTSQTLQYRTAIGTAQGNSINGVIAIELNKWQMFTVTMDPAGVTKLYKNGVRYFYYNNDGTVNLPQVTVSMPINVTRVNNYIGKSAWADNYFTGQMDEVRVYNYALTDNEIAQQYVTDAVLTSVCQTKPAYDINNDCKVNLADFATFAAQWLQCGVYPASACP